MVRGQALFLNLLTCEAGATWYSAGDGRVHLLPDRDLIRGPPLIAARGPAAFPPGSAQSADLTLFILVSLAGNRGIELNSFPFVL